MRTVRNVAVVMALALGVAFLPGGSNAADTVLTALVMGLLSGIAWFAYTFGRQNQLTLATLDERRRALLYGALGMLVLLIAGSDKLLSSGGGTLLLILLFGGSLAALWWVWTEANTYS